jgi:putative ABC transport system ATP-binding protein
VVVSTHDSRLVPLADDIIEMMPILQARDREPEKVELADGEILFHQGDQGELIYVVDEGSIEILLEHADGHVELRRVITVSEYFGEMTPTIGIPRTATARARGRTVLTGYTPRVFRERMGNLAAATPSDAD